MSSTHDTAPVVATTSTTTDTGALRTVLASAVTRDGDATLARTEAMAAYTAAGRQPTRHALGERPGQEVPVARWIGGPSPSAPGLWGRILGGAGR